jgi:hypothetical protein
MMFLHANDVGTTGAALIGVPPDYERSFFECRCAAPPFRSAKRPTQRQARIDSIVDIPVLPRWSVSVARDGQEFGGMER